MELSTQHDQAKQRFVLATDAGESYVTYRMIDQTTVDFDHTFVQPANRGSKVGVTLVKTAVAWAKESQLTIRASCWYVDKYLAKHG